MAEEGAVWPRAWAGQGYIPPDPNEILLSPPPAQAACGGILGEEARWAASAQQQAPDDTDAPSDLQREPTWLDLGRLRHPRTPVAQRVQERRDQQPDAPAGTVMGKSGFAGVWRRLDDATLHRPYRITCWRILHTCLGCNAFLRHVRRSDATSPYCASPACAGHDALETLTHAFLDCPAVRPVITWLCETWRLLSGVDVPRTARLLLADDPEGWDGARAPGAYQLWTRLRVATLGAIWQVRCARDRGASSFANRAVKLAVDSVVGAIRRDWQRTHSDIRRADDGDLTRDWWSSTDVGLTLRRFRAEWTSPPLLCDIDQAGRLQLKLSRVRPVLAPA